MARQGGQRMAELLRRPEQHPIPAPICHAPHIAMAPHLTPQVAEGSLLMGPTLTTHQDVLAEAGNPTPVAGSTNCRPFHPREEPRALTGLRGSVRGVPSNGHPYRDHLTGEDRSQLLLLPDAVDDYVGSDNPVRFIDAFVDGLDLDAAGFQRVHAKGTGRPGYDPGDILKLYLYGYLNRIRSSRRLELETHRNLEVIWLLRRLQPDFKTIADFRRDNSRAVPPSVPELRKAVPRTGPVRTRTACRRRHPHQGGEQPRAQLHAGESQAQAEES